MNRRNIWIACAICTIVLLLDPKHANAASFVPLGILREQDTHISAADVSADGSVVVGFSGAVGWYSVSGQAFRWTSDVGMAGLGYLPAGTESLATGVSADGSVVVGSSGSGGGFWANREAFRWTSGGGMVGLGRLPGAIGSAASAVSDNGLVVVGINRKEDSQEAFRWTGAGGMIGLGDLPGGSFESRANSVSADGAVVVGWSRNASGREAFRWTSGPGMIGLGDLRGRGESFAYDVSGDGSVVIGSSHSTNGQEAFVWDATNGMRSVSSLLAGQGVDSTGWTLTQATAISADGTTIVGSGINPSGQTEAWVANITVVPEPSTYALMLSALASALAWRRMSKPRLQRPIQR